MNLKLSKDIYSPEVVQTALHDYEGLASIAMSEDQNCRILNFSDCPYGEQRTVREFENYLIGLENT